MSARPPFGALLLHPGALLATFVLALNDQVLKARYPGLLTGKLSDLAGMVVAPLVLMTIVDLGAPSALVRRAGYLGARAWISASAVGLMFLAAKTWTPATHAYEATFELLRAPLRLLWAWALNRDVWRERIVLVKDLTDLVALPMGGVAVWIASARRAREP